MQNALDFLKMDSDGGALDQKIGLISCFLAVSLSRMGGRKCAFCKKFLFVFDGVTCFVMMFFCCK